MMYVTSRSAAGQPRAWISLRCVELSSAMADDGAEVSSTAAPSCAQTNLTIGQARSLQPMRDEAAGAGALGQLALIGSIVPTSSVSSDIANLLAEQKRVREERKQLANDLRNAQRRRQRLKHKARLLSKDDLHSVMTLRLEEEVFKESKATKAQTRAEHSSPPNHSELSATETGEADRHAGGNQVQ